MNAPRYARLASKLFVQERRSLPPTPPSAEARARAISAVERVIAARGRTRRVGSLAMALASVAAVAAAVLLIRRDLVHRQAPSMAAVPAGAEAPVLAHPAGAGARMVVSGVQVPLPEGQALGSGSRVVTPASGGATLLFSTGTSAVLGAWSDVTLIGDRVAQVVRLDSGSVELHVAKVAPGQRFLVDTPDAEVEVRGTQFRVSVVPADPSCGWGTWTRVSVTEGVVEVRHAGAMARVVAGEQWPSDCGSTASVGVHAVRAKTAVVSPAPPSRSAAPSAESTLAAQNNLFAQAVATKRAGDVAGAIATLDRFLAKYPNSPLTESVMVERMRLLHLMDPSRGAAAAGQYLDRYPSGFAHAEAESMAATP